MTESYITNSDGVQEPLTAEEIYRASLDSLRSAITEGTITKAQYDKEFLRRCAKEVAETHIPAALPDRDVVLNTLAVEGRDPSFAFKLIAEYTSSVTGDTVEAVAEDLRGKIKKVAETYTDTEKHRRAVEKEASLLRVREDAKDAVRRERASRFEAPGAPQILTHSELMALTDDEDTDYLVDGLWERGTNILLAAEGKAGKSTLISNLIRSLADGDAFLDKFAATTREGRILYIQPELSVTQLSRYVRSQNIQNLDKIIYFCTSDFNAKFNILDDKNRSEWVQQFKDLGIDTIIDDGLRAHLDAVGLDENLEASIYLEAMSAFKAEIGAESLLVTHHFNKSGAIRGSSRIFDWASAKWELQTGKDLSDARTFSAYGRDVDSGTHSLVYNETTRRLTATLLESEEGAEERVARQNKDKEDARLRETFLEIVDTLNAAKSVISPRAIYRGRGDRRITESQIAATAEDLLEMGAIELDSTYTRGIAYKIPQPTWQPDNYATLHALDKKLNEVYKGYDKAPDAAKSIIREFCVKVLEGGEPKAIPWADRAEAYGANHAKALDTFFTISEWITYNRNV